MLQPRLRTSIVIRASQRTFPRAFYRYKSLTAAIQQGRQRRGSDGPFEVGRDEIGYRVRKSFDGPYSLPYKTTTSEFVYGYSCVLAALKANRRNLHKLYIHPRGVGHTGYDAMVARANTLGLEVELVPENYIRAFDKATHGRAHNGFILDASPLRIPTIFALGSCSMAHNEFLIERNITSREDAEYNGRQKIYPYKSGGWRYPVVLYLDAILEEGNLGAIARSAYYFGVDAIVTNQRKTAPWSHMAVKAAAGAAEVIPIFKVETEPGEFLVQSARNGWRNYASASIPPSLSASSRSDRPEVDTVGRVVYAYARSSQPVPTGHCPAKRHPTIIMLGSEGYGLPHSCLDAAHYKVWIEHGRDAEEAGVDSLNVSVAASILCYEALKKPSASKEYLF